MSKHKFWFVFFTVITTHGFQDYFLYWAFRYNLELYTQAALFFSLFYMIVPPIALAALAFYWRMDIKFTLSVFAIVVTGYFIFRYIRFYRYVYEGNQILDALLNIATDILIPVGVFIGGYYLIKRFK